MLWHSVRAKLIVFWVAFAALLVSFTNLLIFETALDAQFEQLRRTLMAIATTGALSIDGSAHEQIPPRPLSVDLPAYRELIQRLRTIRDANPAIRYVYTMVPSDVPGQWYYIGDAEESPALVSLPGERYDVTRYPAMAKGLEGPSADYALTVDEWGALLSGYAPIRNREGKVSGILGIDMSGEHVVRAQAAVRRWAITVLLLGLAAVFAFGVAIAQWISRPIRQLVLGTRRIGSGDLSYRVPVTSHDEVGLLAQSFNRMAERLTASLNQLQEHVVSTIQSLSQALEAKDHYTRGHSVRVQYYAVRIAEQLGLPEAQVELIREMSLLHDVCKIGIRDEILGKRSHLTTQEFEQIKRHPELGYKILSPLRLPREALDIVRYHHEWFNGSGYPAGLREDQIPLPVGIVSVADAFDAMTGHRPYRPTPLTFSEAAVELRRCSGTQFMPQVVEALLEVLRQEGKLPAVEASAKQEIGTVPHSK